MKEGFVLDDEWNETSAQTWADKSYSDKIASGGQGIAHVPFPEMKMYAEGASMVLAMPSC